MEACVVGPLTFGLSLRPSHQSPPCFESTFKSAESFMPSTASLRSSTDDESVSAITAVRREAQCGCSKSSLRSRRSTAVHCSSSAAVGSDDESIAITVGMREITKDENVTHRERELKRYRYRRRQLWSQRLSCGCGFVHVDPRPMLSVEPPIAPTSALHHLRLQAGHDRWSSPDSPPRHPDAFIHKKDSSSFFLSLKTSSQGSG